jgi:ubiquinone/menaquinone biosynthesis C-methylase UbiE
MPRDGYPWWGEFAISNRLRRLIQRPEAILAPYVREGMACLDVGCGMGFFTVPMARMVGPQGRVYAADVAPKVLERLMRRAERAGVADRVRALLCPAEALRLDEPADFAISAWSMHEMETPVQAIACIWHCLKPGAPFLVIEPHFHVRLPFYEATLRAIEAGGFTRGAPPRVGLSRGALFRKTSHHDDTTSTT